MQVHVSPARFGLRDFASACNSVPSAMRISDRFKHVEDVLGMGLLLRHACHDVMPETVSVFACGMLAAICGFRLHLKLLYLLLLLP